jgi:hypothetical protein
LAASIKRVASDMTPSVTFPNGRET